MYTAFSSRDLRYKNKPLLVPPSNRIAQIGLVVRIFKYTNKNTTARKTTDQLRS